MKPKQTEYKGTVFKSKSEAMLACCFDNAGLEYEYEPEIKCDGLEWIPDFIVLDERSGVIFLLEYKPTLVTNAYLRWIENEFNKVIKLDVSNLPGFSEGSFVDCSLLLIYDFYNDSIPHSHCLKNYPNQTISRLISDAYLFSSLKYRQQALNYRFDLNKRKELQFT